MELNQTQRNLIEKLGVFHEKTGMPPTESRVLSLLLVSDEIELTFDEIRETLQVSKSAISNALNTLMLTNKIEYITKSGDRKRYFRSNLSNWKKNAADGLHSLLSINALMKEVLAIRTDKTPEFNKDLGDVIAFIDFLQVELLVIFNKWNQLK
jgi:DNA-binding transcriptional regulator GbsR (MarR family)